MSRERCVLSSSQISRPFSDIVYIREETAVERMLLLAVAV
jgi:hypothetical protein